jgi:hypothetical protein
LYFGGHFWFKMATIANQNGRHMVQHVLFPVNSPQTKFGDLLFLLRFLLLLWTYVKIFDLTYIGNCQRDFHKT